MAATIPCAMLLTACGPKPVRIALPPAELATCADEPEAPSLPPVDWSSVELARPVQQVRDNLLLAYILQFRTAWGSCRSKVDGLAAWRETAGD